MRISRAVVFDVRAVWITEFARALAAKIPTVGLRPTIDSLGLLHRTARSMDTGDTLKVFACRLQRGWWRNALLSERRKFVEFVHSKAEMAPTTCVIFTSPHYATVAQAFGECTTAYYVTDNFRACFPNESQIAALEATLADCVTHVFPNSERIRRFFVEDLKIAANRVTVIPNGVRSENIPPAPLDAPAQPPADMPGVKRPWALVMGNLAANTDWSLLAAVIGETTWLNWVLVGPTEMSCASIDHERIRQKLLNETDNVHYLDWKPPGALLSYARSCDVAVLPYMKREPTYSGSSTRSYEHFAACRPILATDGFAELLEREPLVTVCRSAGQMVSELTALRQSGFRDGHELERWNLARISTWHHRAARVLEVLNSTLEESERASARVDTRQERLCD